MTTYVDTSALAKRYLPERESGEVEAYLTALPWANVSALTTVELRCVLARRRHAGEIGTTQENLALAQFRQDIRRRHLRLVPLGDAEFAAAVDFVERMDSLALRTLALHLAAADMAGIESFATADRRQAAAAELLGFEVIRFG